MAGETKGVAYEALTKLILEDLKKDGKLTGRIFWGAKPEGMTIKPDLTIGRSQNAPEIILMISHGGSAKESNRKYWRNFGELVEAKLWLPKTPLVFSLFFDSVIKESIKSLGSMTYDGELLVGDKSYGDALRVFIDSELKSLPQEKEDKVEYFRERLASDRVSRKLANLFKGDLEKLLLESVPKELDGIWALERKREIGVTPNSRDTFVRRGLSKLLVFEDLEMALHLYSGKRLKQNEVPDYAYELGLASKAVGRAHASDAEIQNAVTTLGVNTARRILESAPTSEVASWLVTLRNAPHLSLIGRYVVENYDELCDASSLNRSLIALHSNPSALMENYAVPDNWDPQHVWLLEYMLELIKRDSGSAAGYGYAQLGREVINTGYTQRSGLGNPRLWIGGFILSDWVRRGGNEQMPTDGIKGIAHVLSKRLKEIPFSRLVTLVEELPRGVSRNILEAKLVSYKGFEPLLQLVREVVPNGKKVTIRSCFAERAELWKQAGTSTVWQTQSSLVNWQSAHHSHTNDKKKELCGRAVALRYSWDAKVKKFVTRPGVKKLILVVDGTWKQSDLDALVRAGWDEIFYPDEMDELAKAIV